MSYRMPGFYIIIENPGDEPEAAIWMQDGWAIAGVPVRVPENEVYRVIGRCKIGVPPRVLESLQLSKSVTESAEFKPVPASPGVDMVAV